MKPLMYRQRPAYPALVGALCVLIIGGTETIQLREQALAGEIGMDTAALAGCLSLVIAGALVIMAFARYQYTHLWKSTGAAHSDKYKNAHKRRRSRTQSRS